MERSYFLFIYNPFALQEFNGNFKWKKIEQNRKIFFVSFFSFSALRFLVYCFCFALLLLSFFFFYQIDLLIQSSVRGIFTSKHLGRV